MRKTMIVLLITAILMTGCAQIPADSSVSTNPLTPETLPSQPVGSMPSEPDNPSEPAPSEPDQPPEPAQYLTYSPYVVSDYAKECMGEEYALYCAMVDSVIAYDGKVSGFTDEGQFLRLFGYLLREFTPAYKVLQTAGTDDDFYIFQDGAAQMKFLLSREEHEETISKFADHINKVLQLVQPEDGQFEIVYKLYEYVATNMYYKMENKGRYLYDRIMEGAGICGDYAQYFQLLLNHASIPCMEAWSTGGEEHAWVVAELEGQYYHFDPTWQANFIEMFWFGVDDQLRKVSLVPEWKLMYAAGMDPSGLPTDAIEMYGPWNHYAGGFMQLPECPRAYGA